MAKFTPVDENTNLTKVQEDTVDKEKSNKDSQFHTVDSFLNSASIDTKNGVSTSGRFIQLISLAKTLNNHAQNLCDSDTNEAGLVVHVLDSTTEDPFTLESFDTLIQQHAEQDKDFILAKVMTADPMDDSKTYHSYYSAHHINKVLFRTQPEQGLLHRMKAKNPLNNMNIIGDVHYYVVKAETVKPAQSLTKSSAMSIASLKSLHLKNGIMVAEISATSEMDSAESDFTINVGSDEFAYSEDGVHSSPPPTWKVEEINNVTAKGERRWSAGDSVQQPPKVFQPEYSRTRHQSIASLSSLDNEKLPKGFMQPIQKLETIHDNTKSNNGANNPSSMSTQGGNGQASNISRTSDPNYKFGLSSIEQVALSKTSDELSIPRDVYTEKGQSIYYYQATFYATDDDFLMRSSIRQYFKQNAIDPTDTQLFSINTSTQSSHATGTLNSTPRMHLEHIIANNGEFLIDSSPTQSRRGSQSITGTSRMRFFRPLRNFRMNKGIKWLVLMYMVFGFLLIRFVVSETYAYLMAFLLMLCLFLVFCVGSGIGIWGR